VGGLGTLFGPILGAFVVVPLNELSKEAAQHFNIAGLNFLLYGLLLMAVILFAPDGLWPRISAWLRLR